MLKQEKNMNYRVFSSNSFNCKELENIVLFLHAFSGCATTSAFYNIGKYKLLNMFTKKKHLIPEAEKFYDPNATAENIAAAGIKIIHELFDSKCEFKTLHGIRFSCFVKSSKKGSIKLESLPPTEGSAVQHSYRTYLQVQLWLGNKQRATDWGWKMNRDTLVPIYTLCQLYPDALLKQISCSCKKGCKVKTCTCKKYGLFCSSLCLACTEETCSNMEKEFIEIPEQGLFDIQEEENFIEQLVDEAFHEHLQVQNNPHVLNEKENCNEPEYDMEEKENHEDQETDMQHLSKRAKYD